MLHNENAAVADTLPGFQRQAQSTASARYSRSSAAVQPLFGRSRLESVRQRQMVDDASGTAVPYIPRLRTVAGTPTSFLTELKQGVEDAL